MQPVNFDSQFYDQMLRIIHVSHHQPHSILGIHPYFDEKKVIRLWKPGAERVFLEVQGIIVEAKQIHEAGIFEYIVPGDLDHRDYRIFHQNGLLAYDPYAFLPTFGDMDQYLFTRGTHYDLYNKMGGRLTEHQGVQGCKFTVWAPNAKSISLVGDFNHWDGRINPMRVMGYSGVWEIFVPSLSIGEKYKFEIHTQQGDVRLKIDPYAYQYELRPFTASIIANIHHHQWKDGDWMNKRKTFSYASSPINAYELHLGSWNKHDDKFLNYRTIAHNLAEYCKYMGYTHVELMPIQEHPLDESWGYQVTGFFAPTSRFGSPDDFQYFVDHLHQSNIGVILDWVPGHFPTDSFSLGLFDGSALYEHQDERLGLHPHWGTHIFNFGRHEVSNFLIANALYWFQEMHVDGLRVDAVASMLYLNYGRENLEWVPNEYGGNENLHSIEFMKHLNSIVHQKCPGILMIAEESTAFPGITVPVEKGGMGFDLKWNMGWMNDTLRYFSKDPIHRKYHQNDLTFGMIYYFSERFMLVLSHDEVVHGKHSLVSKMPGDVWQKFANVRLLLSYMICHPGKKLLFMSSEFGQWNEWNCKREIEWLLLQFPVHKNIQDMVRDINHFYLAHSALWEKDFEHETFQWVDFSDSNNSVMSFIRKSSNERLLCVHNFTPQYFSDYILYTNQIQNLDEIFNSDALQYGGSGKINGWKEVLRDQYGNPYGVKIALAPLATMIFKL